MSYFLKEKYQEEILRLYSEQCGGRVKNYLANPTPANVKKALSEIYSSPSLTASDKLIITTGFGLNDSKSLKNKPAEHFKSLSKFLKGTTRDTDHKNLDLIAVLIDFKPRPFAKFKIEWNEEGLPYDASEVTTVANAADEIEIGNFSSEAETPNQPPQNDKIKPRKGNVLHTWVIASFLGLIMLAAAYYFFSEEEKSCMAWMGEKYEIVPCNTQFLDQNGISVQVNNGTVNIENFRAINPNRQTDFYDGSGNPLVWYANNLAGNPEFFNQHGSHPITNAPLKPVPMQLVARYNHDTVIGKESQVGGSIWEEKKIIPENNYINKNFINSDAQETVVLAFSEKEIDAALIYTISEKISEKDKKVIPLFYPQNFTGAQKEAFAMGDFSGVSNLENYVDDIMVASASYDFRKNSTKETLLVCTMDITYFFYSTRSKTKSQTKSLSVVGSGFSKEEAKQNALKKFIL
jgi:hypothetical protein